MGGIGGGYTGTEPLTSGNTHGGDLFREIRPRGSMYTCTASSVSLEGYPVGTVET